MKSSIFVIAISCLLVFSCQPDTQEIIQEQEIHATANPSKSRRGPKQGADENRLFEGRLQWTSFITAKLILKNSSARDELFVFVQNETVDLDLLIGDNSKAPNFNTAFRELVVHYIETMRNDLDEPRPPTGLESCCTEGNPDEIADRFIDHMTKDNCVELYFPNGIDFVIQGPNLVSSTGHPLTRATHNYGYLRGANADSDVTSGILLRNNHYHNLGIVIVTRPFENAICTYDYGVTDYTNFLN